MLKNPESTLSNEYNICKPYARKRKKIMEERRKYKLEKKKRQPKNQNPWGGGGEPKLSERKKTIKTSDLHEEKKSRRLCVKAFE